MADKATEKRQQILSTALQLFSTKGSAGTSMQEIAEVCGMSKGSLYLHFKSKEELERSIYEFIAHRIWDAFVQVEQQTGITPREQLRKQAEILLVHFLEVREFLLRQLFESPGKHPMDVERCFQSELVQAQIWFKNKLCTVYGEDIEPYTMEIAMFVTGMLGSYIRFLFVPGLPLNVGTLASHLVTMLEDVAASLLRRRPEPLVSLEVWESMGLIPPEKAYHTRHPLVVIKALRTELKQLPMNAADRSDALESLDVLERELVDLQPRRAVLKGMLANLMEIGQGGELLEELRSTLQSVTDFFLPAQK
ncbi:TetR/AcrR family transcriptional regulator [Paenibacillus sp. JSM ZJ436]|uniref:TetR/AcrR family transcriptional regulator n=1 Tax=Paenibacillus sp. JSM ZJ436 TaxID=3376190 RepID=UPI00379B4129